MDFKIFSRTVEILFDKTLGEFDFILKRKKTEKVFCKRVYVNGDWYVNISANIHPMYSPSYYNIALGEGSIEWPDCEWNAVASWRMKKDVDPKIKAKEYSLEKIDGLEFSLNHAKNELLNFAKGFLTGGDLGQFEKVRKKQNKDREKYKIYQSTANGEGEVIIDEESDRLKKRYS